MARLRIGLLAAGLTFVAGLPAWGKDSEPIRIGVINDASGVYADLSGKGSAVAARMAVEEFGNQLLGHKIEVISADDQNKPDVASGIVRKWIDVDHVTLVADGGPSSVAAAIQALAREKKFVFVNAGGFSSALTGPLCASTAFQFAPDTYALSRAPTTRALAEGDNSWYFITADYTFGHALEEDAAASVIKGGGSVLGNVLHPLNTSDFSSFLLRAQSSGAKVIGLANAGGDFSTAIKQAREFGIGQGGQRLAGFLVYQSDVDALGLDVAQGLQFATATYWDVDAETRDWSRRFMKAHRGKPPTMTQSLTYSGVLHYLQAAKAAGSLDGLTVATKMRELPVNDTFIHGATIRDDGRVLEELMLVQVKSPAESKYPFDDFKILDKLQPEATYRPLAAGKCPLVK
jgi:branched-chain amino acid transport system substrate-binding protein